VIRRIDRYELIEQVGTGGMAAVYRGRDTALDREVAVKLLHPHLAARAESRARFTREARAVARLHHPGIVEIYDYAGEAAVESFLVTEFVGGRTLRAFVEQERLEVPEVGALLVRALADALVHAHAAGVIHRDLKPENVLVLEEERRRALKLVDFGIARILASDDRMTMTGALVGSPNHMAPEIIEGREADARSDVFSLGTILYWLATGQMPFAASNPTATLRRVIEGDYTDPRLVAPRVADELAGVLARALQSDPDRRTPSAAALLSDLDAALRERGVDDAEAELAEFLAEPAAYQARLVRRLIERGILRADQAFAEGETARAMKLLDGVLALDPADERVAARLARITSRSRWRRRARRALASAGVLAALLALGWWAGVRRPVQTTPTATTNPTTTADATRRAKPVPAPSANPHQRPGPGREAPATAFSARPDARGHKSAPRLPSPHAVALVAIHVRPYAQRALLDGVEVARGEQRVTFRLAQGAPHRIQVEHACCYPFIRDFDASQPIPQPLELKVPLRARPALLRVEAEPDARVLVDGHFVGTAGESQRAPLEVILPANGDSPYEATAQLSLERRGRAPVHATLKLRAGTELTFAAPQTEAAPSPRQEIWPDGSSRRARGPSGALAGAPSKVQPP
jgi:tRNA A-37 threonylcarbamoyl transferase component Bud32